MIKTVVLDIGNVLVSFYSDIYVAQFIHKKGEIDYFNNICFIIITNVYDGETPPPPPTGDSANLHFVIMALCIVGTVFIVFGLGRSKRGRA